MEWKSTTVLVVSRNGKTVMAGDGQVTYGNTVMKHGARKIRKIGDGQVLAGFAGSVADAMALFDRFESKLKEWGGNLTKAAVELAKDWRTDRVLRRLEALLLVADRDNVLIISGTGEVVQPDDNVAAIGSGAPYAIAAARALIRNTDLDAREIVEKSMQIASEICIYTNGNITIEEI
ncbi:MULTISPECIES: ATP-dependent protease subunit HslV [Pseudothermotoga]|jgi:ATP-dependent HslUV protease subunit HslV|uniref:ATP-dependent protease subunit HslV n=1 Tax=Pseudothermotoga lettingae (strain ATCC BAA-301 / DSM 14385 / NBRC 107922 / TMO) TaxID=416591 RepID=HSLV_PSELT|nr:MULTISPECIES: ATP-dependent protease subunit HslV [Pseudothermotoga]A8F5A7.1 RecName: Full=ATP-dependent protease subunit HslV [Pseudothermotoga lettingae TMO]ABV33341.1 20S proteasome A and B subunits [Pseudothermotoga lettingae TMO]KUK20469.1 MAG: ATP-dependent protease subunit HslV [Pseudothermotoga lettingae]MDI3493987.1 ATP-dependent HslUV protease, peptidase subunit HslV [Pseudothermotoga sp.]MDK2884487.1 ATP-dependent HslUV protease, peptidase subunit HslV [Pseudothermotoga sp.]GLI4